MRVRCAASRHVRGVRFPTCAVLVVTFDFFLKSKSCLPYESAPSGAQTNFCSVNGSSELTKYQAKLRGEPAKRRARRRKPTL